MKRFFLMSYKKAFTITSGIGLIFTLVIMGVVAFVQYPDWVNQAQLYKQEVEKFHLAELGTLHVKGICNRAEVDNLTSEDVYNIKAELQKIEKERGAGYLNVCMGNSGEYDTLQWLWNTANLNWQTTSLFTGPHGIIVFKTDAIRCATGCETKLQNIQEPQGFLHLLFLERGSIQELVIIFLSLSFGVLSIFVVGNNYYKESRLGWRRLTFIISIATAIVIPVIYIITTNKYDFYINIYIDAFILTFAILLIANLILISGRSIYGWVNSGFQEQDKQAFVIAQAGYSNKPMLETVSEAATIKIVATPPPSTSWRFWASTIILLRIIRGLCGLIFAINMMGLVMITITLPMHPEMASGKELVQIILGALGSVFFGWLFFELRKFINWLHLKKIGKPHPSLADKKWAL